MHTFELCFIGAKALHVNAPKSSSTTFPCSHCLMLIFLLSACSKYWSHVFPLDCCWISSFSISIYHANYLLFWRCCLVIIAYTYVAFWCNVSQGEVKSLLCRRIRQKWRKKLIFGFCFNFVIKFWIIYGYYIKQLCFSAEVSNLLVALAQSWSSNWFMVPATYQWQHECHG